MSATNANIQVIDQLVLVSLSDISGISGRQKLHREELEKNGSDLPPDELITLGQKKVIDPKLLSPFNRYKNAAHSLCEADGVRFMGGYAVPQEKVNALITGLNEIKIEFYDYKAKFLKSDFTSWINDADPKFRDALLNHVKLDVNYFDTQIQFGFTAVHVTPHGNSIIQDGLASQIKSLADEVFEDVAKTAEGFLRNLKSDVVSQHTLNPLRRCVQKISSLAFVSPSVGALAAYISDVLNDIPQTGKVSGKAYGDIVSLLNNLADPSRVKSLITVMSDANKAKDANDDADLNLAALAAGTIVSSLPGATVAADSSSGTLPAPADEYQIALASDPLVPAHAQPFVCAEQVDDGYAVLAALPAGSPVSAPVVVETETKAPADVSGKTISAPVASESTLLIEEVNYDFPQDNVGKEIDFAVLFNATQTTNSVSCEKPADSSVPPKPVETVFVF